MFRNRGPIQVIVESIRVQNFRSIRDQTLALDELTMLVGPNGAGKSSFLKALNLFHTPSAAYNEDDFYNKDSSREIVTAVTFGCLTTVEKELFRKYVEGDKLTVEKVMTWPKDRTSQKYHGSRLMNEEFSQFRKATGQSLRAEYNKLREGKYKQLPGLHKQGRR